MLHLIGPFTQILPLTDLPTRGSIADDELVIVENGGIVVENGKVVEVDRATGNTLFEATVFPPNVFFGITFHNALRVNLYD